MASILHGIKIRGGELGGRSSGCPSALEQCENHQDEPCHPVHGVAGRTIGPTGSTALMKRNLKSAVRVAGNTTLGGLA